jgi:hypothetical protein
MKGIHRSTHLPSAKDPNAQETLSGQLHERIDPKTKTLAQACTSSAVASLNPHKDTGPSLHDALPRTARVNISEASIQ